MAQVIKVTTDHAALSRKLQQSVKRFPKAAAAGINKAAAGAFTLSVREIQRDVGATAQKSIRKNLRLSKAIGEKPVAQIIASSKKEDRIPIYELRPRPRTVSRGKRPRGPGVSWGPQGRLIPGSFVAQMPSGHIGVFKRFGYKRLIRGRQDEGKMQPIEERFGPSVAKIFTQKKIKNTVMAYLKTKVPDEIARAFRFVTG